MGAYLEPTGCSLVLREGPGRDFRRDFVDAYRRGRLPDGCIRVELPEGKDDYFREISRAYSSFRNYVQGLAAGAGSAKEAAKAKRFLENGDSLTVSMGDLELELEVGD